MTAALGVLAAAATLACLSLLVRLHALPTGYDPVRDPVSDYGVGRFAGYYVAAAIGIGLAALLVAGGLARENGSLRAVALLAVFAGARFAITQFPTDLEGERPSRAGRIHLWLAALGFAAICWVMSTEGPALWLGWIATLAAVGTLASLRSDALRPRTGLIERVFYAAMLAWFLVEAGVLVS